MEWKLEVVAIPVSDVDRAKQFYGEQVGFVVDHDLQIDANTRVVQLTPPGSACSIVLSTGLIEATPGAVQGVQLVVSDIQAAHAALVERGVPVSSIRHLDAGEWVDGPGGDWNTFMFFSDPDGNGWSVQERPASA